MAPRILTAVALALAAGALVVGSPLPGGDGRLEVARVASLMEAGQDGVTPLEVARWLRDRREDLVILDLRSQEEFDEFHLPRARRMDMAELTGEAFRAEFGEDATVVIYASDAPASGRAWRVLQGMGYESSRVLRGGVGGWFRSVMAPVLPEDPPEGERAAWEEVAELSRYFDGTPTRGPVDGVSPDDLWASSEGALDAAIRDARRKGCGW